MMRCSNSGYATPPAFAVGDFRIRVGLEKIELAVAPEPKINARVAAQLENLVDALAHVDEERLLLRRELGGADVDAVARLILDVVLDLGGRDERSEEYTSELQSRQ